MVGQDELLTQIKSYSIDTLPRTILLIGQDGCGKHTLISELSQFFNIPVIDITDKLSYEVLSEIQLSSVDYFYIINMSQLTEREQNIILKFIEEPSHTAHIILIANTVRGILETVLNRCVTYTFSPYSQEVLKQFLKEGDSEKLLKYCDTPGKIISSHTNIVDLEKLCDTIVNRLSSSRFDNALTISSKLNYKDNYDKFDVDMFFKVLMDKLSEDYILNKNQNSFKLYNIVNEYYNKLIDVRLNKKILIDNMIINMWKEVNK